MTFDRSETALVIMRDLRNLGYEISVDFNVKFNWTDCYYEFSSPYSNIYSYIVMKYS